KHFATKVGKMRDGQFINIHDGKAGIGAADVANKRQTGIRCHCFLPSESGMPPKQLGGNAKPSLNVFVTYSLPTPPNSKSFHGGGEPSLI
ncbi:MAG TPA: hypothetical protein VFP43_17360, partial [Mesorhizobium sp.]|nr:hypothetical protein [Mesorhizobium sp.]